MSILLDVTTSYAIVSHFTFLVDGAVRDRAVIIVNVDDVDSCVAARSQVLPIVIMVVLRSP
jgi:hypothetical protein